MMQYNTFPLQSYNQPSHSSPIEVPGRHSGTSPIAVVKTEEDEGGISPMALHTNSGNGTGVQAIPIASWMSGPQVNINSLQTLSLPATPFPAHATPQPQFASNATTRQPTPIGEDGLCALLGQDQGIVFNPPDSAVDDSNRAGNDGGGRKRSAGAKSDTSMKSRSSKRSRGSGGTTRSAKVRAVAESRGPTFMIKLYALL